MQFIVVDLMKCVKFKTTTLLDQQVRATLDLLSACSVASCRERVHILQLVKTSCLDYSLLLPMFSTQLSILLTHEGHSMGI